MLDSQGLGPDLAILYEAILAEPGANIVDLARTLKWTTDRVKSGLDELAKESVILPSGSTPESFQPVDPGVALSTLMARIEKVRSRLQEEIWAKRIDMAGMAGGHASADDCRRYLDVNHLIDPDEIHDRMDALAAECTSELLIAAPGNSQDQSTMNFDSSTGADMLNRGVVVRAIYAGGVHDRAAYFHAQRLSAFGAQIRTIDTTSIQVIVYDRRVALLPADPFDDKAGVLLTFSVGLVSASCELFEQTWHNAAPFGADGHRPGGAGLTVKQHEVLRLLAEGYTDDTVARRIGVSVRTVRYITADLMAKLGARSRFQSGVRAVELGWLTHPPKPD